MAIFHKNPDVLTGAPREKVQKKEAPREASWDQSREQLSEEILSKISNKEFLNIQRSDRLRHITNPSIQSTSVKEWTDVTFQFSFDGKINNDLYLKTTAGQVLPPNVKEVIAHWTTWRRNGLLWEFFTQTGQRLIIKDQTQLSVSKTKTPEELLKEEEELSDSLKGYLNNPNYELILEAKKRWIPENISSVLLVKQIEKGDEKNKKVLIEEVITEFERTKDYFSNDFWSHQIMDGNIPSKKFLAYYINQSSLSQEERNSVWNTLWISEEDITNYSRKKRSAALVGFRGMAELTDEEKKSLTEISSENIEKWKNEQFWLKITPGSKDAIQLFTLAAMSMKPNMSIEEAKQWGMSEDLHFILAHESGWIVWLENYTLKNAGIDWKTMKNRSLERSDLDGNRLAGSEFWVVSTAIWLGQLTMSNEYLLPHWRKSIWIPLEEAIGMLQYIRERYGRPDIARKVYGTTWHYQHPLKWVQYKSFAEWY